jgi:hypothetical protein
MSKEEGGLIALVSKDVGCKYLKTKPTNYEGFKKS